MRVRRGAPSPLSFFPQRQTVPRGTARAAGSAGETGWDVDDKRCACLTSALTFVTPEWRLSSLPRAGILRTLANDSAGHEIAEPQRGDPARRATRILRRTHRHGTLGRQRHSLPPRRLVRSNAVAEYFGVEGSRRPAPGGHAPGADDVCKGEEVLR